MGRRRSIEREAEKMERQARSDREWGQWPGRRATELVGRDRLRALFAPSVAPTSFTFAPAAEDETDVRRTAAELEAHERRVRSLQSEVEQLLRHDAAELDRRQMELARLAEELERRAESIESTRAALEARTTELGAVELKRAALERRAAALQVRETALERRAEELTSLARKLTELGGALAPPTEAELPLDLEHVLLDASEGYRLHVRSGLSPATGALVELEDGERRCVAVRRSPFPGDRRRCAVVERVPSAYPSQASSTASPQKSPITAPPASAGT